MENMNKDYLTKRTDYLLSKAIEEETQRLKDYIALNPEIDTEHICTEVGVLVALKNYAKDIIKKL